MWNRLLRPVVGLLVLVTLGTTLWREHAPIGTAGAPAAEHRLGISSTQAKFKINGTASSPPGFDATNNQAITLQLEASTAPDIYQTQFFINDPNVPTSPQASMGAPTLTLSPSSGIAATPTGTVTFTMPASGVHTYSIRCVLNGGVEAATGKVKPEWTFERVVGIRSASSVRKLLPGETTQYSARGWSDEQNIMVDNLSVGAGGTVVSVADLAALRAIAFASRVDNELVAVGTPVSTWVFSAGTGANFPDDGNVTTGGTVLKPTDVLLAAAGRWYNASPGPIVPTIAALRLAVSGKQPSISVQAATSLGDQGGGIFDWNSSSTATDDNATIIQPTGIATGRWIRRHNQIVEARAFGVKCDGATNDATALGTAMATAASANFVLRLPVGTCNLGSQLTLTSGLRLVGARDGQSILQATVSGNTVMRGSSVSDVLIDGLVINTFNKGNRQDGVNARGVILDGTGSNVRIINTTFNYESTAIAVWERYKAGTLENNTFQNMTLGTDGGTDGATGELVHNVVVDFQGPISPTKLDEITGWSITNNHWIASSAELGNVGRGLNLGTSVSYNTVAHNHWIGWQHQGIILSGGAPISELFAVQGNVIGPGNTFTDFGTGSARAIFLFNGARENLIIKNAIFGMPGDAIEIKNSPGNTVEGNEIQHCGYNSSENLGAIRISDIVGSSDGNIIRGNKIRDMAAYGIVSEGFCPNCVIEDNELDAIGVTAGEQGIVTMRNGIWLDWGSLATSERFARVRRNHLRTIGEYGIYVAGDHASIIIEENHIQNAGSSDGASGRPNYVGLRDAIFLTSQTVSATTRAPDDAIVQNNVIYDLNSNTTRFAVKNTGAIRVRISRNEAFALSTSPNVFNTDQADTRFDENRTAGTLDTWQTGFVKVVTSGNVAKYTAPNFGTQPVTTTGLGTFGDGNFTGKVNISASGLRVGDTSAPAHTIDVIGDIRVSLQLMQRADNANAAFSWGDNWVQSATTHTWKSANAGTTFMTLDATNLRPIWSNLIWDKTSTPRIGQDDMTTDAATKATTVTSQGPFASSTGSNRTPGFLNLVVPAKASGGTSGQATITVGGTKLFYVDDAGVHIGDDANTSATQIRINTGTAATATIGANGAPPAQVSGYLNINLDGTAVKIPYYNPFWDDSADLMPANDNAAPVGECHWAHLSTCVGF